MRNVAKGCLLILLILNYATGMAQRDQLETKKEVKNARTKYPSLLWKITGNGLLMPSYLYGTMHVSNKIAFHLGDSFFIALKSVDMVALETDPGTWMSEMLHSSEDLEFGLAPYYKNHKQDFYHSALSVTELTNNAISMSLASDPGLLNGMMHRSFDQEDFEEETYLDMFIYQAGHRLKKGVTGLEDPKQVDELIKKSTGKDETSSDEEDRIRRTIRKMEEDGKNIMEMLEDAYRRGDLDLLDSLQRLMNPDKNYLKYMLFERNILMAGKMDSIIRLNKSLFTGIGAAHLAGPNGVIELLKSKGYTLTPVTQFYGKISKTFKEKIEQIRIPQMFKTQKSSDGVFEVFMPGVLYEFPEYDFFKEYFYPDLVNAAYYSIRRIRTYAPLSGYSRGQIMEKIDSLLFENVPGKMISKKSVTVSGLHGFDIICKLKKGDYQRYLILISKVEIFIFRVGGPGNFVKNGDVQKFFKSIRIISPAENERWETYAPDSKGFEFQMPGESLSDETDQRMRRLFGPDKTFQSIDPSGDYFMVKRNGLHDMEYIEEDTFELAILADIFCKKFNYSQPITKEFSSFAGIYPALTVRQQNKMNEEIWIKLIIRGPHYYLLAVKTTDSIKAQRFFSSFKFTPSLYHKAFTVQTDTSNYYTVESTIKQEKPARYGWTIYPPDYKKDENDHLGFERTTNYHNLATDEQVKVTTRKMHKYFMVQNADSFWAREKREYLKLGFIVGVPDHRVRDSVYSWIFTLSDTGSVRGILKKYLLKNRIWYSLSSVIDTNEGPTVWVKRFYESFSPKDTLIGLPVFANKADLFFDDIWNGDSLLCKQALKSANMVGFEDRHAEILMKTIRYYNHELYTAEMKADLVYNLGKLKHPGIIPFLESYYRLTADTPVIQVNILQALGKQKSELAITLFRKLLAEEVPLLSNRTEIGYIFTSIDDSMNIAKKVFPFIMEYTRYPEYRPYIYRFMATLLDSGFLIPKDYESYKKFLIRETKDDLKRQMAGDQADVGYYSNTSKSMANPTLLYLTRLLIPFNEDPEVKAIFNKLVKVENDMTRMELALLLLNKNIPVLDSVWAELASNDNNRFGLYKSLKKIGCQDLIPSNFRDQEPMAKGILYHERKLGKTDTVLFVGRFNAVFNADSGFVYFFKRKKTYGENEWYLDYIGIQPKDTTRFNAEPEILGFSEDFDPFDENDEQFTKLIDNLRFRKRQRYSDSATVVDYYDEY
jgi:uncharacterized protein YbaP (TraB family)